MDLFNSICNVEPQKPMSIGLCDVAGVVKPIPPFWALADSNWVNRLFMVGWLETLNRNSSVSGLKMKQNFTIYRTKCAR